MPQADLCPNCARIMSWVRQVSGHDDDSQIQVFECKTCKVVLVAAPISPAQSQRATPFFRA
jgi:hypothetical protein